MKRKYKVVFTHMNTTHWEVEAYDKDARDAYRVASRHSYFQ